MEFTAKCKVQNLKSINTKTGKTCHIVTLAGFGFSYDFFVPDAMIPDFVMGKDIGVVFNVYADKNGRPSLRIGKIV